MKKEIFNKGANLLAKFKQTDVQTLYRLNDAGSKEFKKLKNSLKEIGFKFKDLNKKQRAELGFGTWSEESEQNGLIPLYVFYILPKKTKLICPLNSSKGDIRIASECDDDTRFGCVAYQFYRKG